MKQVMIKIQAWMLIGSLLIPVSFSQKTFAGAPSPEDVAKAQQTLANPMQAVPTPPNAGKYCADICSEMRASTLDDQISQKCGKPAFEGGVTSKGQGRMDEYIDCRKKTEAQWGHLGPHCEAIDRANQAKDATIGALVAFISATSVCALGCVSQAAEAAGQSLQAIPLVGNLGAAGITAVAEAARAACTSASISATLGEITAMGGMLISGIPYMTWWASGSLEGAMAGGTATIGSGIPIALGGAAVGARTVGKKLGVLIVKEMVKKAAEKAALETTADTVSSCLAASFLLTASSAKLASLGPNFMVAETSCGFIQTLPGFGAVEIAKTQTRTLAGIAKPASEGRKTSKPRGARPDPSGFIGSFPESFDPNHGLFRSALESTEGKIIKSLPGDRFSWVANQLGVNPRDIVRRLESGEGPGQILSGMNGMPAELVPTLAEIDQLGKNGQITGMYGSEKTANSAAYIPSGGGGPSSEGPDFNAEMNTMLKDLMAQLMPGDPNVQNGNKLSSGITEVIFANQKKSADAVAEDPKLSIFDRISFRYLFVDKRSQITPASQSQISK